MYNGVRDIDDANIYDFICNVFSFIILIEWKLIKEFDKNHNIVKTLYNTPSSQMFEILILKILQSWQQFEMLHLIFWNPIFGFPQINIKVGRCGMIAKKTNFYQRPNNIDVTIWPSTTNKAKYCTARPDIKKWKKLKRI